MNHLKHEAVIVGAGLTGLTIGFYLGKAGMDCLLLEKSNRPGGVINTLADDHFRYESGPNTGIIGTPELVGLFDDLKDEVKILTARPEAKFRWIWKGGKWHALPSGLLSAISTPLFSWKDKFRILGEPFRKPGSDPDETLAALVRRRMGKSYLDYAVDPFISGIYSGDPEQLVTRHALPKLYHLEQNYGSFIRGAIRKRKEPKSELEKRVSREVFSVAGGLSALVEAMQRRIGESRLRTGIRILDITKKDSTGFELQIVDQAGNEYSLSARYLIITIPGDELPDLLSFASAHDLAPLKEIHFARVVQVVAGYRKWKGIPIQAFGGLVPSRENKPILGVLFPSSIFGGRAPEKGALLSVFLGGVRRPQMVDLTDDEIRAIVLEEFRTGLGAEGDPDLFRVFRYQKAIPQYGRNMDNILLAADRLEYHHPGLILGGNFRDGIGMADRVRQGKKIAEKIIRKND